MKFWVFVVIVLFVFNISSQANAQEIENTWQATLEHKQYMKELEAWNLEKANEIKKNAIQEITKVVLKDYIADFKDSFEGIYLKNISEKLPTNLQNLLGELHKKWRPLLMEKDEKNLNSFAQWLYNFMIEFNNEKGNAEKFALKLEKFQWLKWTKYLEMIIEMWKQSDIEAAKTPEQKRSEFKKWLKDKQKRIDESQKRIDESQKRIDESQKRIDESQKRIEELNKIIEKLKRI